MSPKAVAKTDVESIQHTPSKMAIGGAKTKEEKKKAMAAERDAAAAAAESEKQQQQQQQQQHKSRHFWDPAGHAIAIRIRELDECCADVPCISTFKEYCESSSLHGLRYITEDGRHWTERVLWVLLCMCGFFLTVYFIYPIWSKWNEKPTITTLDSTDHPVWEINFPGVTVCPANKVVEEKMNKIAKTNPWHSMTPSVGPADLKRLVEMMVHFKVMGGADLDKVQDLSDTVERVGLANLTALMANVMPDCNSFILQCWWQGRLSDCSELFQVRKTNDGFCCSFNALKQSENVDFSVLKSVLRTSDDFASSVSGEADFSKRFDGGLGEFMPDKMEEMTGEDEDVEYDLDITDEHSRPNDDEERHDHNPRGSEKHAKKNMEEEMFEIHNMTVKAQTRRTEIRRLNSANYQRGLTVLLDAKSDDYFVTADDFIGFKMLVHGPEAYPEVEGNALAVGTGREIFISVSASHTEGSKAILDFPFEGRSCLFKEERDFPNSEVTIFKDYTQANCLLECRAKLLLHRCKCLPYYYPRLDLILREREEFAFLKENATCDWQGWQCLANSTELLDAIYPPDQQPENNPHLLLPGGALCSCPPGCARTRYSAAQSFADFPSKASKVLKELLEQGPEFRQQFGDAGHDPRRRHDLSLVHVYFEDLKVFKYHTDELFSWENILASFGGLIGLCTGFSFLSLAELAYFFTLRCTMPICRKRRRRDKVAMLAPGHAGAAHHSGAPESDLVVVKMGE